VLKLYEHSLASALLLLFLISFVLHAIGGAREYSQEQLTHGGQAVSTLQFLRTSEFWFQSFQNWQSEFLAVISLVVLSIVLRQRGSPESICLSHEARWGRRPFSLQRYRPLPGLGGAVRMMRELSPEPESVEGRFAEEERRSLLQRRYHHGLLAYH
jgi:hypothetical protein